MNYCKLSADVVYSSLWEQDGDTCKLWITMLALKDKNGVISQNITGIKRITGVSLEKCEEAIRFFCSPDPKSSSPDMEGRRLEVLPEGGWRVVNHEKYQQIGWSDDKKRFERDRKAKYRENKRMSGTCPTEPVKATNGAKKTVENEPMRAFTDGWMKSYSDRFHAKYDFRSTVDGPAAAALIKLDTPENLLSILGRAAAQTNPTTHWNCINQTATIAQFRSALNKIRVELGRGSNAELEPSRKYTLEELTAASQG